MPVTTRSNKHSTQFCAGDHVELDRTFLEKFMPNGRIARAMGQPGTSDFCIQIQHIEISKQPTDQDALELLRNARRAWDEHLSKISCPSARLHTCLEVLSDEDRHPAKAPLLFVGKGTVADVVQFHASMDRRSINGPSVSVSRPSSSGPRDEFPPKTLLGDWVNHYLVYAMSEWEDQTSLYDETKFLKYVVRVLLEAGADVSPFFEPVNCPQFAFCHSFFSRGFGFNIEPGTSIVQCMKRYAEWWAEKSYDRIKPLDWLIGKIEANHRNHP